MTYDEFKRDFIPELNKIRSFAGRMKYANNILQRIGSGSGRVVYDIDGEKVLKLAKNQKGIAQNETEGGAGYYQDTQNVVTIIFENADDYSWLISEKANKVNEKRIVELTGIPSLLKLQYFLRNHIDENNGRTPRFSLTPEEEDFFWENEFSSGLIEFVLNYSQHVGDMGRPSTYGEVLRNGEPTIVLTDYGLNDEVYDTHYNRARKQSRYQMYELYNYADGNDDILSDTGDQGDIRRGMWAQMPYSVSDGDGVINEAFIKFVSNRNSYPNEAISGLPILTDNFHDCVNNIREVLNHVDNKKQFYENLLTLQEYLIRRGFYDRDLLVSEEYIINEDAPAVERDTLGDKGYGNRLAIGIAGKLGLSSPKFIGGGANGFAYEINNNLVMKITADISEADAASKLLRGKPENIAIIFNLYKVVDTENNKAYYVILQENVNYKPLDFFRKTIEDISKINIDGQGYEDIMTSIRIPKRFDYNQMIEFAKRYLTENSESDVSETDRTNIYNFLVQMFNIRKELIEFGIKSTDYITIGNLGYKDNKLKYFDVGGYRGEEPNIDDDKIISLPENIQEDNVNESYDRNVADYVANDVAKKMRLGKPRFVGSGNFGVAYDIGNEKILKITKDKSEASENLMLIGKQLNYIAQPYNVFQIKSKSNPDLPITYAIVLEKLETNPNIQRMYKRLNFAFEKIMNVNVSDVIEYYLDKWDDGKVTEDKVNSYLKKNPQDAEFFYGLLEIAKETNSLGIESMDYLNADNLGYKKNGVLGFFDVGFGNYYSEPHEIENVEIQEDGSAKFSTDDAIGQDDFPNYDNTADTSPCINNSLDANVAMYEDLEYNRVVGDATNDEYKLSEERNKSYMNGSKTVDVKKKCKLGGLGNTSTACNQGDVDNLIIKPIKESLISGNIEDIKNKSVEEIEPLVKSINILREKTLNKKYLSGEDVDDILFIYRIYSYNRNNFTNVLNNTGVGNQILSFMINTLKKHNILKEGFDSLNKKDNLELSEYFSSLVPQIDEKKITKQEFTKYGSLGKYSIKDNIDEARNLI